MSKLTNPKFLILRSGVIVLSACASFNQARAQAPPAFEEIKHHLATGPYLISQDTILGSGSLSQRVTKDDASFNIWIISFKKNTMQIRVTELQRLGPKQSAEQDASEKRRPFYKEREQGNATESPPEGLSDSAEALEEEQSLTREARELGYEPQALSDITDSTEALEEEQSLAREAREQGYEVAALGNTINLVEGQAEEQHLLREQRNRSHGTGVLRDTNGSVEALDEEQRLLIEQNAQTRRN